MGDVHADVRFGFGAHANASGRLHTEDAAGAAFVQHFVCGVGKYHHFAHQRVCGPSRVRGGIRRLCRLPRILWRNRSVWGRRVRSGRAVAAIYCDRSSGQIKSAWCGNCRFSALPMPVSLLKKGFNVLDAQVGFHGHKLYARFGCRKVAFCIGIKIDAERGTGGACIKLNAAIQFQAA